MRYFGGKWNLAAWIIGKFPRHNAYVEPFGGAASVLLRKARSRVEVYNDVADTVVNFFEVLRNKPEELIRALELTLFAKSEYDRCREQDGTDIERARRFFVRSWGGNQGTNPEGRNRGWRRTPDRNVAIQYYSAAQALHETATRLQGVAIDNLDYAEILKRYDGPDTLFYVDPPYLLSTRKSQSVRDGYGRYDMTRDDHELLLARLLAVSGRVLLSGYPSELYEHALSQWTRYERVSKTNKGTVTEVLWIKP